MKKNNKYHPILASVFSILLFFVAAFADDEFEVPANLSASEILSSRLFSGEYHRVDDAVRSDGYLNFYVLRSDYGDFEVASTALLAIRVREIEALATLDDVSKTGVFIEAAADAGVGQLKTIKQFATHPIESVTGIPKGISRMFKRFSRQAGEAVAATKEFVADDDEDGSKDGTSSEEDSNAAVDLL